MEAKSGYELDFQVCTGVSDDEKTGRDVSFGHKDVMQFMEPYQGRTLPSCVIITPVLLYF